MFIVRCQLPRLIKSTSTSQILRREWLQDGCSIGTGYQWGPGCYVRVNSRPAPEAPVLLLAVLTEILLADFKVVPRTARQTADFVVLYVAKGVPEPQGLLGSGSGYDRYKRAASGADGGFPRSSQFFLRFLLNLSRISHLVMEGPTVQLKDTRVVGKFSHSDFQVAGQASRHRRGSDRSGFYDMTLSPSVQATYDL